jgi:proteic killer suppression protein
MADLENSRQRGSSPNWSRFARNRKAEIAEEKIVPSNRLEPLKGKRKGQHSMRINDQWRICFTWRKGDAFDVEIVNYH